eukprot:757802-Hanusia_phi.AAC.1
MHGLDLRCLGRSLRAGQPFSGEACRRLRAARPARPGSIPRVVGGPVAWSAGTRRPPRAGLRDRRGRLGARSRARDR